MGTLVWAPADEVKLVSDGVVPIFAELSLWYLIPVVFIALWLALRLSVAKGVFRSQRSTTRHGSSAGNQDFVAGNGNAEQDLPPDFARIQHLIAHETKIAENVLQAQSERLSKLIEHANAIPARAFSQGTFGCGDSVLIEDLASIPALGVSISVSDGRSDEEKLVQAKIEDLLACGADPQRISDLTGRPVGEIQVISGLLQRKWHQST